MEWHQIQASRRAYKLRKYKAHIYCGQGFRTYCGINHPKVTVFAEDRDNPNNNVCAKCKKNYES